jgi:hypothetical protein
MTPKQYYRTYKDIAPEKIEAVCKAADTSLANFKQIAIANGSVGKQLAKKLAQASRNEMSVLEILYPEDYSESAA